jgi:hypothetical protein
MGYPVTRQHTPTIQFTRHENVYGVFYKPINPFAHAIAGLVGSYEIPEDRLQFVRDLGFTVEFK